jgi:hypothetical protein
VSKEHGHLDPEIAKDVAIEKIKQFIAQHNLQPGDPFPDKKFYFRWFGNQQKMMTHTRGSGCRARYYAHGTANAE